MIKGLIFNIQRYSLHDGPGIRTTVFFKGCPLKCLWCQNPEGIDSNVELFRHNQKCIHCGSCMTHCHEKAIDLTDNGPLVNRQACNRCMECVDNCPTGTLEMAGKEYSVNEVVQAALKDILIYEESGGGVTISGGEPLLQYEFLLELLLALKKLNIHTAVETSGYCRWEKIKEISKITDLIYYDLKLIDDNSSKIFTGASNILIMDNLERLVIYGTNIMVRMPLIPSVNDARDNIEHTARYLSSIGVKSIELLPYHNLGSVKYEGLDLECPFNYNPNSELIRQASVIFEANGINITSEG